jgi:hypothetical protein
MIRNISSPVPVMRLVKRAICWWFGCVPVWQASAFGDAIPCGRCGAPDISYEDLAGLSRHARLKAWLRYWLFRRWWPEPCRDCGKRFGHHDDCLPF